MKKCLILLVLPLLASCGIHNNDISRQEVVEAVIITETKLPQNNLPKEITIADKKYNLYSTEKASRTTNDGRINYYANLTTYDHFTVFDQIAETEQDALILFKIEVSLRDKSARIAFPISKQNGRQFLLSQGYDERKKLGSILIGTYDKDLHLLRTRIYFYKPSLRTKMASADNVDQIIDSIIDDTKIR
ncbi:hypothetical protein PT276_05835 [Orbaceae bacterium ESL0721]|nr:hypothetical protein [Orbaceae bacterium ESL0721]